MIKIKDYYLLEQNNKIIIQLPPAINRIVKTDHEATRRKEHLSTNEQIAILATIVSMYEGGKIK